MAKQTLQERFIAALVKKGLKEVKRTTKYVVFDRNDKATFYYVGKSGALRVGRTVSTSIPASIDTKYRLLHEAEIGAL